jgi:hypothetical protein
MSSLNFEVQIAIVVYLVIVARWFMVINKYHNDVLSGDTSYKFKDHPIFKGILFLRALTLASIAPLMAFVKPSYFAQFFDGIKVKSRINVMTHLVTAK